MKLKNLDTNNPWEFSVPWSKIREYDFTLQKRGLERIDGKVTRCYHWFDNDTCLFYAPGVFDYWAVYIGKRVNQDEFMFEMLTDKSCFGGLKKLAEIYGVKKVYDDIFSFYISVRPNKNEMLAKFICGYLASGYPEHREYVMLIFMWLYYAMMSEENKFDTYLGASIKMLGIHQLLCEDSTAWLSSQSSRGVNRYELKEDCLRCGIQSYRWPECGIAV